MILSPRLNWRMAWPVLHALLFALWLALAFGRNFVPVQAAKEAPPTVTACLLVATTNSLQISRCQDVDRGIEFYVNSLGFMLASE